jgi:plastocyanin
MNIKKASWMIAVAVTVIVGFTLMAWTQRGMAAPPGDKDPGGIEVKIDNFTFAPASVKVAAGTTITWTNKDDVPHTVVSDDKTTFKSKALDTDEQFSYTFNKPGKYSYFCSVHPKMMGEVIVQ